MLTDLLIQESESERCALIKIVLHIHIAEAQTIN